MDSLEDSDRIKSKVVISGYLSVQGEEGESDDCNSPVTITYEEERGTIFSVRRSYFCSHSLDWSLGGVSIN
jgi:hypothetical protein